MQAQSANLSSSRIESDMNEPPHHPSFSLLDPALVVVRPTDQSTGSLPWPWSFLCLMCRQDSTTCLGHINVDVGSDFLQRAAITSDGHATVGLLRGGSFASLNRSLSAEDCGGSGAKSTAMDGWWPKQSASVLQGFLAPSCRHFKDKLHYHEQ
jgi:hypothetical protein